MIPGILLSHTEFLYQQHVRVEGYGEGDTSDTWYCVVSVTCYTSSMFGFRGGGGDMLRAIRVIPGIVLSYTVLLYQQHVLVSGWGDTVGAI